MTSVRRWSSTAAVLALVLCGCGDEEGGDTPSGDLMLEVTGLTGALTSGGQTEYVDATFSGQIKGTATGPGQRSFSSRRTFEVTSTEVKPKPVVSRVSLASGAWEIKARVKVWTGTCTVTVKPNAVVNLTMAYNTSTCTTK